MKLHSPLPLGHVLIWVLIIVFSLFGTFTGSVEARSTPAAVSAPSVDAAEVTSCTPHAWKYRSGTTHYFSGLLGFPHVVLEWRFKYNGCDVVKVHLTCEKITTIITVNFTWCGWYQPAEWDKNKIHVGANWEQCTIPPIPACTTDYVRQWFKNNGYMKQRVYSTNQPSSSAAWVWLAHD